MSNPFPAWFTDALAQPHDDRSATVDGLRIAYRAWGKPGDAVVVLVHGRAAHAGWWDHVAPHLAVDRRVLAVDRSGHGDSDRGERYLLEGWADEVLAVARAESDAAPVRDMASETKAWAASDRHLPGSSPGSARCRRTVPPCRSCATTSPKGPSCRSRAGGRGSSTRTSTDITGVVAERLGGEVPAAVIPNAGHHLMLGQPIALIAVLQTLIGQWRNHD